MDRCLRLGLTLGFALLIAGCGQENAVGPDNPDPPDPPDPPVPTIPRYDARPTLTTGAGHGCQLRGSSSVCWGSNALGQFGNGTTAVGRLFPEDPGWEQEFAMLTSGNEFSCGLTDTGEAYCWGSNQFAPLGIGSSAQGPITQPTLVPSTEPWSYIEALGYGVCGVTESGQGYCWGDNRNGQVGDSTNVDPIEPSLIAGGHTWYMVSPGTQTCGVDIEGGLWCWGGEVSWPVPLDTTRVWESVSGGQGRTCATTQDSEAWCWGDGPLGNGAREGSETPVLVVGGHQWATLRSGRSTCGITTTEEAFCWGRAGAGEIGSGVIYGPTDEELEPRRVAGGESWRTLTIPNIVGFCGETTSDEVRCWGRVGGVCSSPAWSPEPVLGSAEEEDDCALRILTTQLDVGVRDSTYLDTIQVIGAGGAPYDWSLVGAGLPPGLTLTTDSGYGIVEGVPTEAGSFDFRVGVAAGGESVEGDVRIRIQPCQFLRYTTPEPPPGRVGNAYSYQLEATGADGVYTWEVDEGSLPPGLVLDNGGLISGVPTTQGTWESRLLLRAPNCGESSDRRISLELTVES